MRVAYLVNQYPRVSHTFIRREIAALEGQGVEVERYSLRRDLGELVDEADVRELARTRVVLGVGVVRLLWALLAMCMAHPVRASRALAWACRIGLRSDRGVLRHIAYVAEACVLRGWLKASGTGHVHAHFGTNSAAVAMLCHMLGGPSYSFTVHGPEEFDKPLMLGLQDKIERSRFVVGIMLDEGDEFSVFQSGSPDVAGANITTSFYPGILAHWSRLQCWSRNCT